MLKAELIDIVANLYSYFRYEKMPNDAVINQWYYDLKFINSASLNFIINQITNLENLPRNIPKLIKENYQDWLKDKPSEKIYNEENDFNYPIGFLHKAFFILENYGELKFIEFADQTGMPRQDRERVRNKARGWPTGEMWQELNNKIKNIGKIDIRGYKIIREPGSDDE